ncbi:hypothetical protein SAMN05421863_10822 [Nitrosomonas communis]|uniref:Uncharacterized protein n=1 Tax=Nitrosomonas communis TaxID=44574 RepID=A0A1I4VFN7_9PROT|nr:hypothetical protein SAMN05421863_10822 [Nitrosomonas communis]
MTYRGIFEIFLCIRIMKPLQNASYMAPGANAMLFSVAKDALCSFIASCLAPDTLTHQLRFLI